MSIQPKLSPRSYKKYSIFNDSINIRTSRNTSFDYEFQKRRNSNAKFKNSGSVLRGSKANDFHGNVNSHFSQGQNAFRDKNLVEAIKLYQECILIDTFHIPSHYMLGVSFFSLNQYEKCIRELKFVKEQQPNYNKNVYIILALAYKKISQLDQAIRTLEECLNYYLNCYDALIFKGKLELKLRRFSDCENTLKQAIKLNSKRSTGYQYLGDCQRMSNNIEQCLKTYQIALQLDTSEKSKIILLKMSISLFEIGNYDQSLQMVDKFLSQDEQSSEGNKLKGQILYKLGQKSESMLYFEQSIQNNNSKNAVTKSLIEISKFKIEQKDFYSLYHTLLRVQYLDVEQIQLQPYIEFSESIVCLMKKNYISAQEGFERLEKLEIPFLILEIYQAYKGYLNMVINDFPQALIDFKKSKSLPYNQLLCEGIINFDNFELSYSKFDEAIHYNSIDPNMYKAILLMKKGLLEDSTDFIENALQCLNRAQQLNQNNSQLLYLKSLCYILLNNLEDSYKEILQTIEKADENLTDHYYLKGLILAINGDILNAVQEFTVCLGIDDQYKAAYLQRSKCYAYLGEIQSAFDDMNNYIQFVDDYLNAGNLLYNSKMFEDAYKTYKQECNPTKEHLDQIALCQLQMEMFQEQELLDYVSSNQFDTAMIQIFQKIKQTEYDTALLEMQKKLDPLQGKIFNKFYYHFYKGICLIYISKFQDAISEFERCNSLQKSETLAYVTNFNLMLCWMLLKKFKYSHTLLEQLIKVSEQKHVLYTIRNLLIDQTEFSLGNEIQGTEIMLSDSLKLQPFVSSQFSIFPFFCLPFPQNLSILPVFDYNLVLNLSALSIECRPEAPWIRRNQSGVLFTDNIQPYDFSQTEQSSAEN